MPAELNPLNNDVQSLQKEIAVLRQRIFQLEELTLKHQQSEQILRIIVEGTVAATNSDFLKLLVQKLAFAMQVKYAFITECADPEPTDPPTKFRTLAFWKGGNFGANFEYLLTGTPCELVAKSKSCCYFPTNIQALFPEDMDLVALNADSYIAIPLLNSSEKVMGHLAALDEKPMSDHIFLESIMKIFTTRAAAEMERRQIEESLRNYTVQLAEALEKLQYTQMQLVQSEKMSALGQLVAGIAHEINNPVNFIYANLEPAEQYIQHFLDLLTLYQIHFPQTHPEIQSRIEEMDLEFLQKDITKLLTSIKTGTERINEIVLSLRLFSHLDEAEIKIVDIHQGIDSALMLLNSRIKEAENRTEILILKEYSHLPLIECYARQLNQVFMNILVNAIDALDEKRSNSNAQEPAIIQIQTIVLSSDRVSIKIIDNGSGIDENTQNKLFNPFFTTKPVGKGVGMGLSISYQIIVEKHGGILNCKSTPGIGSEFTIEIPIRLINHSD